jgi:hypothetical protein
MQPVPAHSSLHYKPPAPQAKMLATLTLEVVPFPGADRVGKAGVRD